MIHPNVRKAILMQCKTAKIAQASDSSRVNCTRLKLQIGSIAVQRGVNCTACNELQFDAEQCITVGTACNELHYSVQKAEM